MKIVMTLECQVKCCNGSMTMKIFDGEKHLCTAENLNEGPVRIDCEINWPTVIYIELSNRQKTDTQLDQYGNILKDKAVEVTGVLLNNFPINQDLIDKIFICRRSGSNAVTNENWWSFNGNVQINFSEASPMRYMLAKRNEFDLNRLDWGSREQ